MPMHVIVDGYNVLGTRGQVGPDSERAREQLVHELMNYRQRKGHAVTVASMAGGKALRRSAATPHRRRSHLFETR